MGYKRLYKKFDRHYQGRTGKIGISKRKYPSVLSTKFVKPFFETQDTEEQMKNRLHGIPDFIKETLGDIKVTSKKRKILLLYSRRRQ